MKSHICALEPRKAHTISRETSLLQVILRASLILLLILPISGCEQPRQQNSKNRTLRIAHGHWPGFDIAHYGVIEGYFEKRGVKVELIRMDNQFDATRQMARGRVDACFSSASDLYQNPELDGDHRIILITNISNGSDGIVARKGIESVKDLASKKVSAKMDTVNEVILLEALDHYDVNPNEVKIEDISNESAITKFIAGNLDAAAIWEPLLSEAARKTGGKVIYRTGEIESLVIDCMVADAKTINARKQEFEKFALAWLDIMNSVNEKPDTVFKRVAELINQDPNTFASDYQGLQPGDKSLNHKKLVNGDLSKDIEKLELLLSRTHPTLPDRSKAVLSDIMKHAIIQWKPLH